MDAKENFISLAYIATQADLRRIWSQGWQTITPEQRIWTRYLLGVWGEKQGGTEVPDRSCTSTIGRLMLRTTWSDLQGDRIIQVVNQLYKNGFRGSELFDKARQIIIPSASTSHLFAMAKAADDATFVEKVMIKTLKKDNPLRYIAIKRYCNNYNVQNIAKELQKYTGCDIQYARKRISWCEKLLESVMFYAIRRDMDLYLTQSCNALDNFSKTA